MTYSQNDVLRIAKRVNNTKRSYLLVNRLQAKHIPVSPGRALEMMEQLGDLLAQKYPDTRLVIGFAETATAIGAAVASRFGDDCIYLHTTREALPEVERWVLFSEEHSHAVEQKLCGDRLTRWISASDSVLFVDDEISTGKTLINMMHQLRAQFPVLSGRRLAAASLLNRVSPEHERRMAEAGLRCEWLVRVDMVDPAQAAAAFQVEEAAPVEAADNRFSHAALDCAPLPDPRTGVSIRGYRDSCEEMSSAFLQAAGALLGGFDRAVVLGTEECMYPALILGKRLEERGLSVRCHATTRSPIGICSAPDYPITSGRRLSSFYEEGRDTYIYNFSRCDALIVVSDAPSFRPEALNQLAAAWAPYEPKRIFFIQGGHDVWYV